MGRTMKSIVLTLSIHLLLVTVLSQLLVENKDCTTSVTNLGKTKVDCNNKNLGMFPSQIPATTNILLLRNNKIKVVPILTNLNLTRLEELDLAFNEIYTLPDEVFRNVSQLQTLDLRYNPLFDKEITSMHIFKPLTDVLTTLKLSCSMTTEWQKSLLKNTLSDLKYIRQLYITGSRNLSAVSSIASQLQTMERLDLYDCSFLNIVPSDLLPLQKMNLKEIILRKCGIESIQQGAFSGFLHLESISLACNERLGLEGALNTLKDLTDSNLSTVVVDRLNKNQVTITKALVCEIPILNRIKRLSLQSNSITKLQIGFGKCLNSTEILCFGYNEFLSDEPECEGCPDIPSLEFMRIFPTNVIRLSLSHWYNDETNFFDRYCNVPSSVDIETNDFFPSEPTLQLTHDAPHRSHVSLPKRTLSSDIPVGYIPPKLHYLYIDNIGMQRSPLSFFAPEMIYNSDNTIKYLNLSNGNLHLVEIQGPFWNVGKLEILDVTGLAIERVSSVWATELVSLRELNVSHNLLGKMAPEEFSGLAKGAVNLEKIDLSYNYLKNISVDTFSQVGLLKSINLEGNQLKNLRLNLVHLSRLEFMSLAGNELDSLNESLTDQLNFVQKTVKSFTLDLRQNSFVCGCNNIAFIRWFQATNITIPSKGTITCREDWIPSPEFIAIDQVSAEEVQYKCEEFKRYLIFVASITCTSFAIALLSGTLMYKFRWSLRWKLYQMRQRMRIGQTKEGYQSLDENNYNYSAFVICAENSQDRQLDLWLSKTMPANLEDEEPLRRNLYLLERDGNAGSFKTDVVFDGLCKSRRFLIVLHPSCVGDGMWQFAVDWVLHNRPQDAALLVFQVTDYQKWPRGLAYMAVERDVIPRFLWSGSQDGQNQFWSELKTFIDEQTVREMNNAVA